MLTRVTFISPQKVSLSDDGYLIFASLYWIIVTSYARIESLYNIFPLHNVLLYSASHSN